MYARVTSYRMDPAREDEAIAKLDDIRAQVAGIDGIVCTYSMWNDDGGGLTVSIYESEAAADAATAAVQQVWGSLADLITAPPEVTGYSRVEKIAG